MMTSKTNILRLDASANRRDSNSKKLGDLLIDQLRQQFGNVAIHQRDLNEALSFIDDNWIRANFTGADQRDQNQNKQLDIVITTGGAPLESPVDFVSGYLKQVFSFIGIDHINIIGADQMKVNADASFAKALAKIEQDYPAVAA